MGSEKSSSGRRQPAPTGVPSGNPFEVLAGLAERLAALARRPESVERDTAIELLKLEQLRVVESLTHRRDTKPAPGHSVSIDDDAT